MIDVIFSQLICNQEYFGRVWPYLNKSYFERGPARNLFNVYANHVHNYNGVPSKTALGVALDKSTLSESDLKATRELLDSLSDKVESTDWTVPETEKYVQDTAIYNATSKIIEIQSNAELPLDKQDKRIPGIGAILDIMKDAVSVSFDSYIGHNWMDDYEQRWLMYKHKTNKLPFKMKVLNVITKGGVENATLNLLLAGVNTGKSMGMISLASDYIEMGKNVLYISMEMSEEMCSKRIDANLLDITLDELDSDDLAYSTYKRKIEKIREKGTYGNLYVKAYGTGTANANNFRSLINELKLKKNFKPDVIFIDYLGICGSVRIKQFTENSYTLVKTIAEELRALAFEFNIPIWSAAQTTRGGWDSSDLSMSDVAESAGLVATCDFMLAIIETTELAEINQQMIKQLKSRYGDKYYINKFNIKVKKGNQKWIEMDPSEQRGDVAQNSLAQQMQANSKKLASPSTVKSKIDNLIGDLQSDLTQQDLEPDKPKPVKDKPKPNPIKKSDSIKDEFSDEDTSDGGFKVRERKTVNLKNVNF